MGLGAIISRTDTACTNLVRMRADFKWKGVEALALWGQLAADHGAKDIDGDGLSAADKLAIF